MSEQLINSIDNKLQKILSGNLNVKIYDDLGHQIVSFGSPSTIADYRSPKDFTAVFATGTTIVLTLLPNALATMSSEQIVYIKVIPASGSSKVYTNGASGITMTYTTGTITMTGATTTTPFVTGDKYEIGINSMSAAALLATLPTAFAESYTSPTDYQVSFTSSTSITITGANILIDDTACYVFKIDYKPVALGVWKSLTNTHNGCSIVAAAGVITVTGVGTPFVTGDLYRVVIFGPKKAYDPGDFIKTLEGSPLWSHRTDKEALLAAAQTMTAAFVVVGYQPAVDGYCFAGVWIKITMNQATAVQIQILAQHTSAGTEEYFLPIEGISPGLDQLTPEMIQIVDATASLYFIRVKLDNVIPFIKVYARDVTAGTHATIDTAFITKGY